MPLLLLFFMALVPGLQTQSSADWEPAPFLQDGETMYACAGDSVEFAWRLNPQGSLRNVQDIKFLHQNKENFLKFNFSNSDRIASINIRENKPEAVLISHEEKYRGRIGVIDRVMTLRGVRVADSGLYSMVVKGQDRATGAERVVTSIVTLVVADDLMTTDKGLHISESDTAFFNETTGRHHKVLECGQFTYNTQPPFDVVWTVPGRGLTHSTEYRVSDGRFRLVLPLPMRTGSYGCSITKDNAARACAKQLVQDRMSLDATDTRFWLQEKDLARVQKKIENKIENKIEIINATTLQGRNLQGNQISGLLDDVKNLEAKNNNLTAENKKLNKAVNVLSRKVAFAATSIGSNYPVLNKNDLFRFQNVQLNTGGGYDASTGKFRAPVTGTFYFATHCYGRTSAGNKWFHVQLRVDGNLRCSSGMNPRDTDAQTISVSCVIKLNEGQHVYVQASDGGFIIESWPRTPVFSGFLIYSD